MDPRLYHRRRWLPAPGVARAGNRLAKTDKIDAAMLAEFGRCMRPEPAPKLDPKVKELRALVARREDLVAMRSAELNRLEQITASTPLTIFLTPSRRSN